MSYRDPHDPAKRGLLVYAAIGDAYGMAYEFTDDNAKVGPNDLTYKSNPKFPAYQKGRYTDDTQMQWVNGEIILQQPVRAMTPEMFADAWVFEYQQDPRPGYSRFMEKTLKESANGAEFMSRVNAKGGTTSGGAMRAPVIGLLRGAEDVKQVAEMQARITHDTQTGILSAQAAALAVHGLHYNLCDKAGLSDYIDSEIGTDWRTLDDGNDPKNGLYVVKKAIGIVADHNSMSAMLRAVVDSGPGQDTDTIAAMALAIASRSREATDDLPDSLFAELEMETDNPERKKNKRGGYGRDFLEALDRSLQRKFFAVLPTPRFEQPPFSPF